MAGTSATTPVAMTIVAATATSADFLGYDDLGTVAVGKSADFVVLNGDPLADIRATREIDSVYVGGRPVSR